MCALVQSASNSTGTIVRTDTRAPSAICFQRKARMKTTTLALCMLAAIGAGCATLSAPGVEPVSGLPDCFESNYDRTRDLFTLNERAGSAPNQQSKQ